MSDISHIKQVNSSLLRIAKAIEGLNIPAKKQRFFLLKVILTIGIATLTH
jgi:PleD family two-component response regulator